MGANLFVGRLGRGLLIAVSALFLSIWIVLAGARPALASCTTSSGPCTAVIGLVDARFDLHSIPFTAGSSSDATPNSPISIHRSWTFAIGNFGPATVMASYDATSPRTFFYPIPPGPPPPPFSDSGTLVPGTSSATLRNTSQEIDYALDTQAPGFSSSRSVSPLVIPPGGTTQTLTATFTDDDAAYNSGMEVLVGDPGVGSSWTFTSSSDPTDTTIVNPGPGPSAQIFLNHPVAGTTYTFTFTGTIPNTTSQAFAYKPRVLFQFEEGVSLPTAYASSYSLCDTVLEQGPCTSGNNVTYTFDQAYELHPATEYSSLVDYTGGTAPVTCPVGTKINVRWHYSANGSSGSWSGTNAVICPGSLTMGPQAMEGDLKVSPGATLIAGYDFTVPGNAAPRSLLVSQPQVVFAVHCASGATPSQSTLTVPMPDQGYSVTNAQWYPSGDQSSPLTYQGSIVVPDLCGGGQLRLDQGGTFTANAS